MQPKGRNKASRTESARAPAAARGRAFLRWVEGAGDALGQKPIRHDWVTYLIDSIHWTRS